MARSKNSSGVVVCTSCRAGKGARRHVFGVRSRTETRVVTCAIAWRFRCECTENRVRVCATAREPGEKATILAAVQLRSPAVQLKMDHSFARITIHLNRLPLVLQAMAHIFVRWGLARRQASPCISAHFNAAFRAPARLLSLMSANMIRKSSRYAVCYVDS